VVLYIRQEGKSNRILVLVLLCFVVLLLLGFSHSKNNSCLFVLFLFWSSEYRVSILSHLHVWARKQTDLIVPWNSRTGRLSNVARVFTSGPSTPEKSGQPILKRTSGGAVEISWVVSLILILVFCFALFFVAGFLIQTNDSCLFSLSC